MANEYEEPINTLLEKYDIALSYLFGCEEIDLIANAKNRNEIEGAVNYLQNLK